MVTETPNWWERRPRRPLSYVFSVMAGLIAVGNWVQWDWEVAMPWTLIFLYSLDR